ncbi:MAG TPA: nucleoside monophosphate kinase [Candidatus Paceibacterota bacterium]
MTTPQTFVFIGRSGSGKGTQAKLLINRFVARGDKVFYVETGEQFRSFLTEDTYSSQLAKQVSLAGNRQPDFMAIYMWANLLVNRFGHALAHLFFDGSPRSLVEAQAMDTAFNFYQRDLVHVVALHVSHTCATDRLTKRGRSDDDEVGVKKRLAWYEQDVVPALDYYRTNPRYRLVEIDGERLIEEVHADILTKCDQA